MPQDNVHVARPAEMEVDDGEDKSANAMNWPGKRGRPKNKEL